MVIKFDVDEYIAKIEDAFNKKRDAETAIKQAEYMQDNFKFFGIHAGPRRKAVKKYMKKQNRPDYDLEIISDLIKKLWQLPEREYQYFGTELLERYSKKFDKDIINLMEYIIVNKSWWDTVDRIAKKSVGRYLKKFPDNKEKYLNKWLVSDNIWLQRTTLLFQLEYKEETDRELLFELVNRLKGIDEFFIQKAIGWSLREYSKIDAESVEKFIAEHELSSLSKREGLKVIKKNRD